MTQTSSGAGITPGHRTLQEAAQWYAKLANQNVDALTRQGWERWLAADPMHRLAWQAVERISQRFEPLQLASDATTQALHTARRASASRRQMLRTLAICSGGALLSWLSIRHTRLPQTLMAWRADQRTGVGEVRDMLLSDGTHLWLNSATALDIDFNATQRTLRLLSGEVLIQTARDARPFFVETPEGRMQALGTRFSVLQQEAHTRLNVFEGAVEVRNASGSGARVIHSGEQIRFDPQTLGPVEPASQAREGWSHGLLLANNMRLADFVAELSRYRHDYLGVAPEVANLLVVGAYPLHDTDQTLAMLESALPVRLQRTLPWWTTVEAR